MGALELKQAVKNRIADEQGEAFTPAPLKVALCYPSPYHVGMSSLGFQQIYRTINALNFVSAERVFLPDDLAEFEKTNTPLFTYETQSEVNAYDALAFSVAYELELGGLFSMLSLANIPVLREERTEQHPPIVAGGPLTFSNPDPLEPFVDVLVQGEAEDLMRPMWEALAQSPSKADWLSAVSKLPGVRVPGVSAESTRYFVAKSANENLPAQSAIVTPHTELRNMFLIEPSRGCSRGCHYCVMRRTTNGGMRLVNHQSVIDRIPAYAKRVGLVGAAVTDHPKIVELLETIVGSGRDVGVSSLRADRLTQPLVNALRKGGAKVLTVASDGASQKMRNLVDRKHTEEQIVRAANFAKTAGIERLKVYNVIGLPFENDEDIDELIRFSIELSKILPIALGVAPFAAKRHTPLDGAPFAGIKNVEQKLERLRRGLRGRAEVRPTSARWAWVEYMLAQAGPEAGLAAYEAHKNGGRFADWKKAFKKFEVKPFLARRTPDGRRQATQWPQVSEAASRI